MLLRSVTTIQALLKATVDAHRHHARRVREEKALKSGRNYISAIQSVDDPRAQGGGVAGTNQHGSFSQIGVGRVGDGAPPEDAGSRENLLDILAQQMEEESSGIGTPSNEEFAQLISLIIATNSADACAQSIEALPELIEDLIRVRHPPGGLFDTLSSERLLTICALVHDCLFDVIMCQNPLRR